VGYQQWWTDSRCRCRIAFRARLRGGARRVTRE
jgi:hypothetical protein